MRITCLIFGIWLMCCNCPALGNTPDTLLFVHETESITPVVPDSQALAGFKDHAAYDYYNDQVEDARSIKEITEAYLRQFLHRFFDIQLSERQANITSWITVVVVVALLILLLIFFRPSMFYLDRKKVPVYRVEDESIYGVDFDQLILNALASSNYTEAIRWRYLQTLKKLEEKELIVWNPNKTVNEYVAAFKQTDVKPLFSQLSRIFLYFRYGNFDAKRNQYDEVDQLAGAIIQHL